MGVKTSHLYTPSPNFLSVTQKRGNENIKAVKTPVKIEAK